ncbi:A1 cistron-splicing factor [Naematelia encephala]|uniref:A1 cistron-splicing factor n=1 Tax=Naematelia encephala TaxID=71784 RepID=A0A1Y2BE88_9TREE|nr:A1 cistron-splicing factor [Naematelia encephala]
MGRRFHLTRDFSGIKLLPPGLHLLTFSAPSSSSPSAGPAAISIRYGILRYFTKQERYFLSYDPKSEQLMHDPSTLISDDQLRVQDAHLAPYPFQGLEAWQSLTNAISREILIDVLGQGGAVDGMRGVIGQEDEAGRSDYEHEHEGMRFITFDLRRSWRDGAVGEEVSRFSMDKSWLLASVIQDRAGGDPMNLIGQIQLSFILLLYLSSYSALTIYKLLLSLLTRSSSALESAPIALQSTYTALIHTLSSQLSALPDHVFDGDLPEMDLFYLDEIESLAKNLSSAISSWGEKHNKHVTQAWQSLGNVARNKFNWHLSDLAEYHHGQGIDEQDDEQGEYAPVIVDT